MPEELAITPEKRKEQLLKDISKTVEKYGKESDIPITHPYWNWVIELRLLP